MLLVRRQTFMQIDAIRPGTTAISIKIPIAGLEVYFNYVSSNAEFCFHQGAYGDRNTVKRVAPFYPVPILVTNSRKIFGQ